MGAERSDWIQTESRKVKNDFGGNLIVTPDENWLQKWSTPSDQVVYFNEADVVEVGKKLWILTFFVNPKLDSNGDANLVCTLTATRPDSSVASHHENFQCLEGKVEGALSNVRLSPAVIGFVGEQDDQLGEWTIDVQITDENRDTVLDLQTSFTLVNHQGLASLQ